MLQNRSMPASPVIPVLAYPDVAEAVAWLGAAFGFTLRLGIGDHRAQLHAGSGGHVVVTDGGSAIDAGPRTHSVMLRVEDAHAHATRAAAHGARIVNPPTDYPFGERQYTALDHAGHAWTFSQSIADVDPASWGGDFRG